MGKPKNKDLLEFFEKILEKGKYFEKDVIKDFGKDMNNYLERSSRAMTSAIGFNKDEKLYFPGYFPSLENKIDSLERKIQNKQQVYTNIIIATAISIQALGIVLEKLINADSTVISFLQALFIFATIALVINMIKFWASIN